MWDGFAAHDRKLLSVNLQMPHALAGIDSSISAR